MTAAARAETKILTFGDSLTAGYGLPKNESFPAMLQAALRAADQQKAVAGADRCASFALSHETAVLSAPFH